MLHLKQVGCSEAFQGSGGGAQGSSVSDRARSTPVGPLYVRSEQAGHRVMESITRFITQRRKLQVNEAKSAVARPQERRRPWIGLSGESGRSRAGQKASA